MTASTLQLRVGLNSGQVIAGEIGSGPWGYTAIGEQVGMAQRMESVAPPGGVMLSESTARLVENAAVLGEPEVVQIKGSDPHRCLHVACWAFPSAVRSAREPRILLGVNGRWVPWPPCCAGRSPAQGVWLVWWGRRVSARAASSLKQRPSRPSRGVRVFSTFCESHASEIPFHVVARLLRAAFGVDELADDEAARAHLRTHAPDAEAEDLLLLDDLLGIRDPNVVAARHRSRRPPAAVDSAGERGLIGSLNAGCLRHRGCALDRRGQ